MNPFSFKAQRLALLAIAAALAALGLLAGGQSAEAAYPGGNGKIAFESDRDGLGAGIWTMNADGSGATKLTSQGGSAAWSPDGQKIAYTAPDGRIAVVNADGTGATQLTSTGEVGGATWSPDGTRIAFFGDLNHGPNDPNARSDIYVMNADGTGVTQLTNAVPGETGYTNPAWSPNGQKIALHANGFIGSGFDGGYCQLYLINADGSGRTQLTFHNHLLDPDPVCPDNPSWSPDGSKIAFDGLEPPWAPNSTTALQVWVINADGTGETRLTGIASPSAYWLPAWSPDGQKIAFQCEFNSVGQPIGDSEICAMNADGSGITQLTGNDTADAEPDWQPLPGSGDVIVTNCDDPALATLTSIQGDLVVDNVPGCTNVSLPNLQHVGGSISITGNTAATGVNVGALTTVSGSISITGNTAATGVNVDALTTVGGSISITGNTAATGVNVDTLTTVSGSISITGNTAATGVNVDTLTTVGGSISITGNTAATGVNVGALTTVSGSLSITGNTAATGVNVDTLTTVTGDLTVTTAGTSVDMSGASVGGDLTVTANGADPVSAKTPGGTTDVTVLGGGASMHVVIPDDAFDQPVVFTITRSGDTPPVQGTDASGGPALIDPVAGDLFTFAIPTLNQNAQLTFTVDLSTLDPSTRTALVGGVQDGSATIAVKGDAQGAAYQAFARCAAGQSPATDGCVDAVLLDANGQPTQNAADAAFARFDGVAGHFSTYSVVLVTPEADTAPPAVAIRLTGPNGGVPDGQNGWFVTGPVNGTVTADDRASGGSNVSSISCGSLTLNTTGIGTPTASGTFAISTDGTTHISCTATDSAGNTSQAATTDVQLDTHAPTLTANVGPTPILLHGSATATPTASDAGSGVASQSCGPVDTSSAGVHTLACTAKDNAGNSTTISVSYLVEYKILGFFAPVPQSKWKAGQTVPIKIALADADGARIPDSEAQGLLSPTCLVTFSASGAQTASACMKYDIADHQYIYNWKLGTNSGNEAIAVTVSYPGTTNTTTLSEPIVITS